MRRGLATAVVIATIAIVGSSGTRVATQAPAASPTNAARTTRTYTAPRTPWGDPDLQGTFTNKYEQSTPMERPKGFEGRRVDEIQGAELTKVLQERQRVSDERAPFLAGDPTGQIRGNGAFSDRGEITKGSRAWMIVDPVDGLIPPLTPEAQRLAKDRAAAQRGRRASSFTNGPFDSFTDFSLYDRCITRGLPNSMLPAIYGDSYDIVQGPGFVAIRYEMIHETRVIPLDPSTSSGSPRAESRGDSKPHAGSGVRFDMGDARGRWEGDTLVVETTNFNERSIYRNANPESLKLVERFTRTAPNIVEWSVTVDDPKTWTKPWTFSLPLTLNSSEPVLEYACHEGNYAVHNMLSASRAEEKAKAGK
jgi:hypothetical protein